MATKTTLESGAASGLGQRAGLWERLVNWRRRNREMVLAYGILTPMIIYLIIFTWLPVLFLVGLSLTEWNIIVWPPTFVGIENYKTIFTDPYYFRVFINTFLFAAVILIVNLILGFTVALMLNQNIRGRAIFRTLWYVPAVLSGAVMAQVMAAALIPTESGTINVIIRILFGADPVLWPRDAFWMPFWVIVFSIWRGVGWSVIFFLAGLQSMDPNLSEAAQIDGANGRQVLRYIIIPQMAPIFIFVSVTGMIGGMQLWEAPMVMTGGGPNNSTNTLVFSMYRDAFGNLQMGTGAAQAALLMLVISIGIGFQLRYYRRVYS